MTSRFWASSSSGFTLARGFRFDTSGVGVAGRLAAPTIGYPSPIASNPATIAVHVPADWQSGDALKLARSSSAAMTSPTILTHTLIDADIGGTVSIGLSGVTLSGITYFQAYGSHSGLDSTNISSIVSWGDTTAPTITTSATQSITETSQLAVALTGTDTGGIASWSIAGGLDQLQFAVVGSTLEWYANGYETYDTGSNNASKAFGGGNTYNVIVQAADYGGNTSTQAIAVTVTAIDQTPDDFSFTTVSNAPLSTLETSNTVTLTGLQPGFNIPSSLSGTGFQYSKSTDGGVTWSAWTAPGSFTVQNNDKIKLQVTSSASYSTGETAVLSIGLGIGNWTVTTQNNPAWLPSALFASGEAGYVFDPSDTSKFFQDSAGTTAGAFGSPIGLLKDAYSGGGHDFSQATSGKRPGAVSPGWVNFDGTSNVLSLAQAILIGGSTGASIIMAVNAAAQGTTKVWWGEQNTGSANAAYRVGTQTDNATAKLWESDDTAATHLNSIDTLLTVLDGSGHILSVTDTLTGINGSVNVWKDRTAASTNPVAYVRSGTTTLNVTSLGANKSTSENAFFSGKVGRAIFINRPLTPTERGQAEAWCAAPYGITLP